MDIADKDTADKLKEIYTDIYPIGIISSITSARSSLALSLLASLRYINTVINGA